MLPSFLHKLVSHPRLYDFVQRAVGAATVRARLASILASAKNQVVLDVGAGTGGLRASLPENCHYIWMDNDPDKMRGFAARNGDRALLGSALQLALAKKSVDQAICVAVSHHLEDSEFRQALGEIARVVRHRLVFLDAVACPRLMSRMLWGIDRGSHPRPVEALRKFLEEFFVLERAELFQVRHRYFVCVARPKAIAIQ